MKLNLKYEVTLANNRKQTIEVTSDPQDKAAFEAELHEIYGERNVKEIK